MSVWLVILLATTLLSIGLVLIRKSFYRLAEGTGGLLNALLDDVADEMVKQRRLITAVGKEMKALLIFLLLVALVLAVASVPLWLPFGGVVPQAVRDGFGQMPGIIAMLVGGTVPFIAFSYMGKKTDYTEWSILLHRMVLDNQHLGAYLFAWDAKRYKRKHTISRRPPILVSGLARSGTTALTTILARSQALHSLSYASMPFLLCPNIWGRFVKPATGQMKERSHGDKVLFGYDSVEALEEYFFKVFLKESYITATALNEHEVDAATFEKYVVYRDLVGQGHADRSTYLAKNNNAILRYASLRRLEPEMKVVFLFRDPVDHAYSLMKQHQRFSKMQTEDPFVLEYMNWLGHHEFGKGLKQFVFTGETAPPVMVPEGIDHWVRVWIHYYKRLLELVQNDGNTILVDYAVFLKSPREVVDRIGRLAGIDLSIQQIDPFENLNKFEGKVDVTLLEEATALHARLRAVAGA